MFSTFITGSWCIKVICKHYYKTTLFESTPTSYAKTPIFVVSIPFCNYFYEEVHSGEVNPPPIYIIYEITIVTYILKTADSLLVAR
jgi:hypothetical protein